MKGLLPLRGLLLLLCGGFLPLSSVVLLVLLLLCSDLAQLTLDAQHLPMHHPELIPHDRQHTPLV